MFYHELTKDYENSNLKPESLLALKVSVERSIQLIKNGDISLTNRILLNVKKSYDRSFYLKDPVSIINETENKIFSVFDPKTDYGLFSDICLTVRLYPDWFLLDPSDGEMHEYYEKVWKNSNEGQLNRLIGASGEGVNMDMPESLELIKEELLNLKEKIKNKRKYKESNVGKLLSKLSSTSNFWFLLVSILGSMAEKPYSLKVLD